MAIQRQLIAALLLGLLLSLGSTWIVGANLGGAFAPFVLAAVLVPICSTDPRRLGIAIPALAAIGIAMGASILGWQGTIATDEYVSLTIALLAFSLAMIGLTRLFMTIHIAPTIAAAGVVLAAIAWLAWPVWLSPWLTGPHANHIATLLAKIHPLLAINGVTPRFGYWTQSHTIYRYTSLGQDVAYSLPDTVTACVIVHALIGLIALAPCLFSRIACGAPESAPRAQAN